MTEKRVQVSEEQKKEIFELISTAGVEIKDIVKKTGIDYDTVMKILSEEYLKNNLDFGRRLCCRY